MAYEKKSEADSELPEEGLDSGMPFPEYDLNVPNIALEWAKHEPGKEELKLLGDDIIQKHDECYDSSEKYRKNVAKNWALFTGDLPPKEYPFKDCANANVPIIIENISRNSMRAFGELFGDWFSVFGAVPMGPGAQGEAELVTAHSNWQIREQITDFKRQMYRAMLGFFFIGDLTCHSFYDARRRSNRHEFITPDEFTVPFTYTSTQPDYSDCPHYSKILNLYKHDLQARMEAWANVKEVLEDEPTHQDEPQLLLSEKTAKTTGIDPGETVAPHRMIWFEGWLELPNQSKDKWCRVVVDYKTHLVMELVLLEEPAWQDVERYNAQLAELEGYRAENANYLAMIADQEQQVAQTAQEALVMGDLMGPEQKQEVAQTLTSALEMKPEAPIAPTWLDNPDDPEAKPEEVKTEPIYLFTHFVNIEPLVGTLGIGWGGMQGDISRAANTMFNQYIDAATLSNIWGIIKSDQVKFKEEFKWGPGAMNEVVGLSGEEIKANIMELKAAPPSPELINGVSLLYQWAASSMQSPSVLSGEPGKSGESAKLQLSRVEQATKQISVTTRKFADDLEYVAKNNAKLNRIYMPDEEIISVAKARGAPMESFPVKRSLYDRNYRFTVTADLRFTSKAQRVTEADELATLFTKQFPQQAAANPGLMYQIMKKCVMAREQYDLLAYLGPDPMSPEGQQQQQMQAQAQQQQQQPQPPQNGAAPGNTPYQGAPQPPRPPSPPGAPGAQGMPNGG
jgi:hypothetical protein